MLYKFERAQFAAENKKRGGEPADLYGGVHLLRLLVKLDPYFNYTANITLDSDVFVIKSVVQKFARYLEANQGKLLAYPRMYSEAPESYKGV